MQHEIQLLKMCLFHIILTLTRYTCAHTTLNI